MRTTDPVTGVADGEATGVGVALCTGDTVGMGDADFMGVGVAIGVRVGTGVGVLTGVGVGVGWNGVGVVGVAVIGALLGEPPPPPWPAARATTAPTATTPPTMAIPAPPPLPPPPPLAPGLGLLDGVSGGLRLQCADAIWPGSGNDDSTGPKEGGGTLTSCVPTWFPEKSKNVKRMSTADVRGGGCIVTSGVTILVSGSMRSEHDAMASVLSTMPMMETGVAANVGGACIDPTKSAMAATYPNIRRKGMVANIGLIAFLPGREKRLSAKCHSVLSARPDVKA
jgi:hypothetical protein